MFGPQPTKYLKKLKSSNLKNVNTKVSQTKGLIEQKDFVNLVH